VARPVDWLRKGPVWRTATALGVVIAALALIVVIAVFEYVRLFPEKVTRAGFQSIRIGMPQSELYQLLGSPGFAETEWGLVEGPDAYVTNASQSLAEKQQRGFQEYRRQQWISSEITIIVIFDGDGTVVCRYASEGQQGWLAATWAAMPKLSW